MIIDSPIISGSFAASGSLNQFGNVTITGSLTVSGPIIGSITGSADSASFATTASYWSGSIVNAQSSSFAANAQNAVTASYLSNYIPPFPYTGSAGISGSLTVNGPITAQTLIVQTITSSEDFVTGSTHFGSLVANTHQFTGSVTVSGSLAVNGSSAILTNQTGAMSVATASYVANAVSASYAATATSASYASASTSASYSNTSTSASYASEATSASLAQSAISASYALTASYASNVPATSSFAVSASIALNAVSASYITGSNVIGTVASATSASYALTASYASNVPATSSFAVSASQAQNAVSAAYSAYALTSSYSLAGSGFPFSGSAVITGSLLVTNLSSSGVSYLVADSSGFVTAQSASAALKSTQAFTSTAGQTTFSVTNGYATGYVDVFINGSKLSTAEFTDTSGTNIVLATGSFSGDTVEVVKYTPAAGVTNNVLRQLTTFTASAGQTVFSASYTPGLLDIFYNGSRLSPSDFTANNGTFFTLATGSAVNDILDVLVYSYQVGAFSGIGGVGTADQIAYFGTTNSITGSPNFTISGSTMLITGSLTISGSSTFTNIGPAVFSGSLTSTAGFTGSFSGTATSASYAANADLLDGLDSTVFTLTSSFAAQTASFTAFTASQNILNGTYATTSSNTFTGIQTVNSNLVVTGSITAQTLVVQTITSSVVYSSGSNVFGNNISNTQVMTGSVLISSGSVLNIGRTDTGYPLTVASQFAKTDTTGRGLAFFGSNELYASNPFGLVITFTGAATLTNRYVQVGTTDFGSANGGNLIFQGGGGSVGIGTITPITHATASGLVVSGTGGNRGIIEIWDGSATAGKSVFQNVGGQTYIGQLASGSGPGNLNFLYGGTGASANVGLFITGSNGNVGIGTTAPLVRLQVGNGTQSGINGAENKIHIASNTSGGRSALLTLANSSGAVTVEGQFESSAESADLRVIVGSTSNHPVVFRANNVEVMRISGSNVGMGASSPRTRLQVTPVSNAETPVLGTANGIATFTSANTNYGLQLNSTSDGTFFMQSQRFDALATAYTLGLNPVGGYVYLGKGWGASNHRINLEVAQGNNVLVVSGYSGASNDSVIIKAAAGANPNATTSVMEVTTNSVTGRSISAGGTINASGTDYAEYIEKAVIDIIAKGDIVGINSDAKLTNIFADAISFVVKSTDPSYVGGDAWGNIVGKRPERTTDRTEEEFAPILAEFEAKLETARAKVDRIAFSGQVPCNVTGANVGDYIIPIELENGKIGGQAVTNPTFEQYQISVGKVWKIMDNGKAWVAVKIG